MINISHHILQAMSGTTINYRHILDTIVQGVQEIDCDGTILFANKASYNLLGYKGGELIGQSIFTLLNKAESKTIRQNALRDLCEHQPEPTPWQARINKKNGTPCDIEVNWQYERDEAGEVIGFITLITEINSSTKDQEYHRQNEQELLAIYDNAPLAMFLMDQQRRIIKANKAAMAMARRNPEELLGRQVGEALHCIHVKDSPELCGLAPSCEDCGIRQTIITSLESGQSCQQQEASFRFAHPAGEQYQHLLVSTAMLSLPHGPAFLVSLEDISARREAEKALQASLERLKDFELHRNEGVFRIDISPPLPLEGLSHDEQLRWLEKHAIMGEISDSLATLHGLPTQQIIGKSFRDLSPEAAPRILQAAHAPDLRLNNVEIKAKDKHGNPFYFLENMHAIVEDKQLTSLWGTLSNITAQKEAEEQRRQLETQLNQAQKMEAIGTLAGGIAHDFNNILSAILGYADLAQLHAPTDSSLAKNLQAITEAGHRASILVQQILTFSRQSQVEKSPIQPQSIIKEAIKMLRASLPTTISINTNIDQDCPPITADPTQLYQIIINLCTNSFQAMAEKGGTLTLDLRPAPKLPPDLAPQKPRDFIELAVHDTGQGIGPDIIKAIFEPYFTTKEVGKGTGMGLAITYAIVKEYGGAITVESEPGTGTTFHLYFPKSPQGATPSTQKPAADLTPPGGNENILFVDDERLLVELGQAMLENLGYQVTTTQSPKEALTIFMANPTNFDLVITDQTMPEMTGLELARHLLKTNPDIPIILSTGYSSVVDRDTALACGITSFSPKPLAMATLARLIRKALSKTP